ncbi:hypothetical protein TREMEDRAFT_58764 [Tremella mesenterica DSM 1558]|uniref:uncharacterized protein n=1 Tax=Tremella mesenterica (strain ATCC 24925 / CBS 8224 / DSM 1558 / NBRC 9311 / NRRL Y-6157 / RJB 2259-6 / UBC 559-6) TaxID=578456 RepID=UPI0003F4965B|nr:uncharacterized protein TREMEDRAFT_58764 [Tremella mesenterica DSM 1558]EIW72593.1 hypothetical protein TREMEDRAFT_58764 [Tremella mesenterica DSM 1558]
MPPSIFPTFHHSTPAQTTDESFNAPERPPSPTRKTRGWDLLNSFRTSLDLSGKHRKSSPLVPTEPDKTLPPLPQPPRIELPPASTSAPDLHSSAMPIRGTAPALRPAILSVLSEPPTVPRRPSQQTVSASSRPLAQVENRVSVSDPSTPRIQSPANSLDKTQSHAKAVSNRHSASPGVSKSPPPRKGVKSTPRTRKPKSPSESIIDLTYSPPGSPSSPSSISSTSSGKIKSVTPRSAPRRRRGTDQIGSIPDTPARSPAPSSARASPSPAGGAIKCAGYTRAGHPCKRLVKVQAPYLSMKDTSGSSPGEDTEGEVEGFYIKGKGTWVKFDDYVPKELGQQTQTLLRTTMESRLTEKEDLQSPNTCFFKVGRTDNVPRRIGEWTNQCQSHKPTLREIFPRRPPRTQIDDSQLSRRDSSYLPGAISSGSTIDSRPRCPAMKRWEKLVHLELSELSFVSRPKEFEMVREKCNDCGKLHREVFPLPLEIDVPLEGIKPGGGREAYETVVEIINRWEKFIREVAEG